jgi:hypothetical protein
MTILRAEIRRCCRKRASDPDSSRDEDEESSDTQSDQRKLPKVNKLARRSSSSADCESSNSSSDLSLSSSRDESISGSIEE